MGIMNVDQVTVAEHGAAWALDFTAKTIAFLDAQHGNGYAMKNPGLVGALVGAAALNYQAGMLGMAADRVAEGLETLSSELTEALAEFNS